MNKPAQDLQAQEAWDITEITAIEQQLAEVKAQYSEVPDFDTKEGYKAGKAAIKELTTLRTSTDKARLAITKPHRDFIDRVNKLGKALVQEVELLEKPHRDAKAEVDERAEREKEKRIADLRGKIERDITAYLDSAVGLDAAGLRSLLEAVEQTDTHGYYDVTQEAEDELARVTRILRDRLDYTAEQEQLAAERAELEREKEELRRMRAEQQPAQPEVPSDDVTSFIGQGDSIATAWDETFVDLMKAGVDASVARELIEAIIGGKIRHLTYTE